MDLISKLKKFYSNYEGHINALKLYKEGGVDNWSHEMQAYTKYLVGKTVLVLGCGIGHQCWALNQAGFDSYGCDISIEAIRDVVVKNCIVADVMNLPYKDKSFDNTLAFDVLEHVPIDFLDQAIVHCERVTRNVFMLRIPHEFPMHLFDSSTIKEHYVNAPIDWWMDRLNISFISREWKGEGFADETRKPNGYLGILRRIDG